MATKPPNIPEVEPGKGPDEIPPDQGDVDYPGGKPGVNPVPPQPDIPQTDPDGREMS